MNRLLSHRPSLSAASCLRRSALLAAALAIPFLIAGPLGAADTAPGTQTKPAAKAPTEVKGTCTFGGTKSNWSAKLTPTATPGVYNAAYTAAWGGNKAMTYTGTFKTDWKTEASGNGKSTGGGGNGSFEFAGKFADDVAKCPYKEIGGRGRSGSLTVDAPK